MVCVEHCDFSITMFLASVFSSEIFHNVIIRYFLQSCSVPSASETNYHLELEILLKLNEIPEIVILYKSKRDYTVGNLCTPDGFEEVIRKSE